MIENLKKEKNIYNKFITFVFGTLFILMLFLINAAFSELHSYRFRFGITDVGFIVLFVVTGGIIFFAKKKKISNTKIIIGILCIGLILRLIYCLTTQSIPISDFAIMYETAGDVLKGDLSMLWGTGYIARFPHITIPTLYYAAIRYLFSNPLIVIKIVSACASTCTIFLIYKIANLLFDEKKATIAAYLAALYPPLILYTAVYTTENLAIPMFLAGIYNFLLYVKGLRGIKNLIFAGILVSVGNLFRMVGIILIAAFVLYIIASYKETIKKKIAIVAVIIVSFAVILVSTSFSLHYSGIMEYQLWKGREPSITNILKGTNIEYAGRWNPDDAAIPENNDFDYDAIEKQCKEIIWYRLSNTPINELFQFYVDKYTSQWCSGDFSGAYWAEHGIENEDMILKYSDNGEWFGQLYHCILLVLTCIGLLNFKKVKADKSMSLIYYIFCGYSIFYLISENQARYAFVVCWIFILMALMGLDLIEKLNFGKGHTNE